MSCSYRSLCQIKVSLSWPKNKYSNSLPTIAQSQSIRSGNHFYRLIHLVSNTIHFSTAGLITGHYRGTMDRPPLFGNQSQGYTDFIADLCRWTWIRDEYRLGYSDWEAGVCVDRYFHHRNIVIGVSPGEAA